MLNYLKILCIISLGLSASNLAAQTFQYSNHIGSEDGLNSQLCQRLEEDKYGNLWIATFNDLHRYDGYKTATIPLANASRSKQEIVDIGKDADSFIWLLQGASRVKHHKKYIKTNFDQFSITIIDPIKAIPVNLYEYLGSEELLVDDVIMVFFRDSKVYILTQDHRLFLYTDKLELYANLDESANFLTVDPEGLLVYSKDNNISFKDSKNKELYKLSSKYIDACEAFSIGKNGYLYFLNQVQDSLKITEYFRSKPRKETVLPIQASNRNSLKTTKVEKYKNGNILINGKLFIAQNKEGVVLRSNIGKNSIYEYLLGKTGLGYVATNLGVYVHSNNEKYFKTFALSNTSELNSVRSLFKNEHLMAYKNSNYKEDIIALSSKYDLTFLKKEKDLGDLVTTHYLDPLNPNQLWSAGYLSNQIRLTDFEKQKVKTFSYHPVSPNGTSTIIRSKNTNKIYAGTRTGLYYLDKEKESFIKLETAAKYQDLDCYQFINRDDNIWIASNKGIVVIDEVKDTVYHKPISKSETPFNIQYIHEDKVDKNIIWLGVKKTGLLKYNLKKNSFTVYNTENGLSNNDVHAIIEDDRQRLWISTNRNLNCLDKTNAKISIFTQQDGIAHQEFNRYGFFNDTLTNTIYFGGINGYTYFQPDSINTTAINNKIKLRVTAASKTKKDFTSTNIFNEVHERSTIELEGSDIAFQLDLSTNYMYDPRSIEYSYRIPGLYDEWETQRSNTIRLARLPYGIHDIEIISDLNKPATKSDILRLKLNVIQPFRTTWTAYILAFILSLCLIALALKLYLRSIKERNTKLEAVISQRTKELQELNQTKNKLFTILAHDLRSPIGSLNNITEKIKFLSKQNRLAEIDILAEQTKDKISALNESLNNIFIWALSENKMLIQKPEKLSLKFEINKILDLYSTQVQEKKITTSDNLEVVDQVFLDAMILQTLLRNIISNALKFSPSGSHIEFIKTYEDKNRIQLIIRDQGIGMDQKSLYIPAIVKKKIIDLGKGSGIGLKIILELAEVSNVKTTIESNKSGGTDFILDMPKN